jgi:hypothetical protein
VVKETVDILEMFSLTMFHFRELPDTEQEQVRTELGYAAHGLDKSPGFDRNNDDHFGVASYLVQHLRRFKDLPGATNNSHTQTSLPRYRKMLSVYLPMRGRLGSGRLTSKEVGARKPRPYRHRLLPIVTALDAAQRGFLLAVVLWW